MISLIVCSRVEGNLNHNLNKMLDSIEQNLYRYSNCEVLVAFDTDDKGVEDVLPSMNRPFVTKYVLGPRERGYIDLHKKYNSLLPYVGSESKAICALADDCYITLKHWDQEVLELSNMYSDNIFFIHGRPHPPDRRHDLHSRKFNMDFSLDKPGSLTGIDEAPIWGVNLMKICGNKFYVSFTDAWTISVEHKLWNKYGINRTQFLSSFLAERHYNHVTDGPGSAHFDVDRVKNFEWMSTSGYLDIIDDQAASICRKLCK